MQLTARVHEPARRHGGRAARSECAADDMAHRHAPARNRRRCGISRKGKRVRVLTPSAVQRCPRSGRVLDGKRDANCDGGVAPNADVDAAF
jgi:hypothetical protein